jgi:hypothetical protein
MAATSDVAKLFTVKHATYARFIRLVRYPQSMRTFCSPRCFDQAFAFSMPVAALVSSRSRCTIL